MGRSLSVLHTIASLFPLHTHSLSLYIAPRCLFLRLRLFEVLCASLLRKLIWMVNELPMLISILAILRGSREKLDKVMNQLCTSYINISEVFSFFAFSVTHTLTLCCFSYFLTFILHPRSFMEYTHFSISFATFNSITLTESGLWNGIVGGPCCWFHEFRTNVLSVFNRFSFVQFQTYFASKPFSIVKNV